MEMRLSTDQLCARARFRERENVWSHWIAIVACMGSGVEFVYLAITMENIWLRLAHCWMAVLMVFALWGLHAGARRIQTGESCAQFMIREFEGSRRTLLAIRWGIVLMLPSLLTLWWGNFGAIRVHTLHLNPTTWRYYFLMSPWRIALVVLALFAVWVKLDMEARKRDRQAQELRRAIKLQM